MSTDKGVIIQKDAQNLSVWEQVGAGPERNQRDPLGRPEGPQSFQFRQLIRGKIVGIAGRI